MIKNQNNDEYIEMSELSKKLKASDSRTALKWCEDLDLPIIPVGKKKVTYRFLAEIELDKRLLQLLKKRHPSNWQDLYKHYKNNDHYSFLMAIQKESSPMLKIETTKPRSRFAKEFAKH